MTIYDFKQRYYSLRINQMHLSFMATHSRNETLEMARAVEQAQNELEMTIAKIKDYDIIWDAFRNKEIYEDDLDKILKEIDDKYTEAEKELLLDM